MELKEVIKEKLSKDEEQLNFIFSDKMNIIVTAPAGCGKTTAMITKIAWELSTGHIHSNKKVLAMTFSVNAAMKIKDSLKILLPDLVSNPTYYLSEVDVANYHNFAMRVLFKHGYCLNSEFMNLSDFQVVDDADKNIKDNLDEMELEMFQKLNITLKTSNKIDLEIVINNYWNILNKKLITKHIITYNGILVAAIKLLQKEQIKKFYKKYYEMVIVDEFQDTNLLGYLLICELIGDNISIFLGDDVQKIYGFMGAVEKIFDMISITVPTETFEFKNNYRFKKNNRIRELDSLIRNYAERCV